MSIGEIVSEKETQDPGPVIGILSQEYVGRFFFRTERGRSAQATLVSGDVVRHGFLEVGIGSTGTIYHLAFNETRARVEKVLRIMSPGFSTEDPGDEESPFLWPAECAATRGASRYDLQWADPRKKPGNPRPSTSTHTPRTTRHAEHPFQTRTVFQAPISMGMAWTSSQGSLG